jgi:tetratricopeptide (TPR) repeat protein
MRQFNAIGTPLLLATIGICLVISEAAAQSTTSGPAVPGTTSQSISVNENLAALPPLERGDLLMTRHAYAQALDAYQSIQPRTAPVWNRIGVAYHHLFALDEALQSYRLALLMDPHYSEAFNNVGAVYYGKQEYSMAEKAYRAALKYDPQKAITYHNLGTAYFAQSKYKKGASAYRKAYGMDPAVFLSEDTIDEVSTLEQRRAIAFSLAELYASLGRTDLALVSLRRALSEGFSDRKRLREDKELAMLRDTPEFHRLLVENHLE